MDHYEYEAGPLPDVGSRPNVVPAEERAGCPAVHLLSQEREKLGAEAKNRVRALYLISETMLQAQAGGLMEYVRAPIGTSLTISSEFAYEMFDRISRIALWALTGNDGLLTNPSDRVELLDGGDVPPVELSAPSSPSPASLS